MLEARRLYFLQLFLLLPRCPVPANIIDVRRHDKQANTLAVKGMGQSVLYHTNQEYLSVKARKKSRFKSRFAVCQEGESSVFRHLLPTCYDCGDGGMMNCIIRSMRLVRIFLVHTAGLGQW